MDIDDRGLGERIRAVRLRKNLTIRQVAATTHLTSSQISQFERGKVGVSLSSLRRIAHHLDVNLGDLLAEPHLEIIRKAERQQFVRPGTVVPFQLLSPDTFQLRVVQCRLAPGQSTSASPMWHAGAECTVVVSGQVSASVGGEEWALSEGDTVTLDSRQPHLYTNVGTGEAVLLMVVDMSKGDTRS